MSEPVRAAGGVLYRDTAHGVEVCLVHRQRYDDWSLPKGHLNPDEHPLLAAAREVAEETGVRGVPQLRLRPVAYTLPDGRPKTVEFWLMRAEGDDALAPADTDEVDRAAWLPVAEAAERVSYADDRALLGEVAALPPITSVAGLVRHAHAGERKKWTGNDSLRPIDTVGQAQAELAAALYTVLRPARLFAATPLRCKQTLEPLAAALGLPIVLDSAFAEPAEADDAPAKAKLAAQRLLDLREPDSVPVVCSQGKVMPHLLAALRDEADPAPYKTPKGDGWVLTWSGERLLGLSRL